MLLSKTVLCILLVMASLCTIAIAQRGGKLGGRTGTRNRRPGSGHLPFAGIVNQDPNSHKGYYESPLGAKITKASHFDYEYILGHKVVFICEAQGDPRPGITWFKDNMELYAHPYLQLHEWKIGDHMIKSKMEIDPATQMDAGLYECQANNKYSIDRRSFKADFSIGE